MPACGRRHKAVDFRCRVGVALFACSCKSKKLNARRENKRKALLPLSLSSLSLSQPHTRGRARTHTCAQALTPLDAHDSKHRIAPGSAQLPAKSLAWSLSTNRRPFVVGLPLKKIFSRAKFRTQEQESLFAGSICQLSLSVGVRSQIEKSLGYLIPLSALLGERGGGTEPDGARAGWMRIVCGV